MKGKKAITKIYNMATNPFLDFLRETLQRLFQKSPAFFKWWQIIWGALTLLSGIPLFLTQLNISLPEPFATMSSKLLTGIGFGAWAMSQLAVKKNPVAQTDEGKQVNMTDEKKLPFTARAEEKEVQRSVPPLPVVEDIPETDAESKTTIMSNIQNLTTREVLESTEFTCEEKIAELSHPDRFVAEDDDTAPEEMRGGIRPERIVR